MYISDAASEASIGFIDRQCRLRHCPPPPKLENSTPLIGRFIALAMSWVSNMPAAPTTVPAMISASICIT
jgi:hypothetical protein